MWFCDAYSVYFCLAITRDSVEFLKHMDKISVAFLKDMGNRVIQKLHTLPEEIIHYILSCIDVTLLRFLLRDKSLQPYVLRIMLEKIAIDPR